MKIISHRGAKGLATENTTESISMAAGLAVDYIEFDIHHTRDNQIVAYHDFETPGNLLISDLTLKTLRRNVPELATLKQALTACGKKPALIESKSVGTIAKAINVIREYPNASIASFRSDEILAARIHLPSHQTFLLQHYYPFGVLKKASSIDAGGIGINKNWLIALPYYYWRAMKNGLKIYTYTINSPYLAKALSKIMPNLYICTDHPQKMFTKK